MRDTLDFPELLRLIDERSAAFRAAVAAAPGLDTRVPTCPEWTLSDLVRHLGEGRRTWAATIAAGPDATAKAAPRGAADPPREREALLAWSAEATRELLDALREAGPDRRCWAWWGKSQSPLTCGAVARRQLHEIAVHTYDAQVAAGAPQRVPDEVALDGVEEFLLTFCTTTVAWPHEPAAADYHATEGRSWRHWLSADGARVARLAAPEADAATTSAWGTANEPAPVTGAAAGEEPSATRASARGNASDLVLALYGRIPLDSLQLDGTLRLFDQLVDWDPES